MPKSKNTRKKKRKKKGESHPTGRPRPVGPGPIKSMAIGGAIMLAVAAFFFWRVGGETPFNHILDALGLTADEAAEDAPATDGAESRAAPSRPEAPKDGADGKPMEKISNADQKRLDDLINDLK